MTETIITVQPSASTDQIAADGTELQQLPFPFHVRASDGGVERQDFWQGDPARVIGFAARLDRQKIDLWWEDAVQDPQRAVGMYVVTQNAEGGWATHLAAVQSMAVHEVG